MNIGVFDSGKGGEYIAEGLKKLLPEHTFMVVNDREHVPYGSRSNEEIITLTTAAITPLLSSCPIIVIACNTATMAAITTLREQFPGTMFVGTEPMIKPAAAASHSRRVTVLATPLTLASQRYKNLKALYSQDVAIDEPSTQGWAATIEGGNTASIDLSDVKTSVANGSDSIILACTHYLVLKPSLEATFPSVTVYEPTNPIAQQIARLAEQTQ